jgi:hypothetical protein
MWTSRFHPLSPPGAEFRTHGRPWTLSVILDHQNGCLGITQVEQICRLHRFAREPAACSHDRGDTSPRRLHPPHPYPQQMLTAVARLPCEVCRLDPPALDELLQSRRHVQYVALYADAGWVSIMNDGRLHETLNPHSSFSLLIPSVIGTPSPQTLRGVEIGGSVTPLWESVAHDVNALSAIDIRSRMSLSSVHLQCFRVTGMLQSLVTYRLLNHARRNRSKYTHPQRPHPG